MAEENLLKTISSRPFDRGELSAASWERNDDLPAPHTIPLLIIGLGFYELGHLILVVRPWEAGDIVTRIRGWTTLVLLALALSRMAQYWTVRHPSLKPPKIPKALPSMNPPPTPQMVSWTSIVSFIVGVGPRVVLHIVVRPIGPFIVMPVSRLAARFMIRPVGRLRSPSMEYKMMSDIEIQKTFAHTDAHLDDLDQLFEKAGGGRYDRKFLAPLSLSWWQRIAGFLYE
jgi:hypothetical protein